MIQDEDIRDDDVIDPEDPEVELEGDEAEADFDPDADKISEEEEGVSDVTAFGFVPAFIPEAEEETLDESEEDGSGSSEEQPELTAEEMAAAEEPRKYRILSPIPVGNGQGQTQGEYPVGVIAEFPTAIGDLHVEEGRAERVQ